jgi:hypothetical protein
MRKIIILAGLLVVFPVLPARAVGLAYKRLPVDGIRFQETRAISLQLSTTGLKTPPVNRAQVQTEIYRETVPDAGPEGVMSLVRQTESSRVTPKPEPSPAQAYDLPGTQSFLRLTGRGKILSLRTFLNQTEMESGPLPADLDLSYLTLDLANLEAILAHPPLPGGEVQINQSWSEKIRLPNFLGAAVTPVTLTSRLLEITKYQGRDCAKIRTSLELLFYRQYPQILTEMQVPQGSLDNLKTQGRIIGRIEWLFDIKQGCMVYAEGPLEISAKSDFYFFDSQNHTVNSSLSFALKSYNKTQLLEAPPQTPEIQ